MQVKTLCFFCMRKIWQVFAITLVTLAVVVSVIKYSLPYANDYRDNIERMIQQHFDVSLSLGSISGSWESNGPALVLENLTFVDNERSPIALTIKKASLQLNVLESIKHWQIRSNYFVLDGFSAQVDLAQLAVANDSAGAEFEQQALIESLFLGETGHFSIQSSQLNLRTKNGLIHTLLLNDLTWQNSPLSHQGEGEIAIPGLQQGRFSARLALSGSSLRDLAGQIYLQAQNVDVAEWLTEQLSTQELNISTDLNGELWMALQGGQVQDVIFNTLPSKIQWQKDAQPHAMTLNQGHFQLTPTQQHWRLQSSKLLMSFDETEFVPAKLEAEFGEQGRHIWFEDVSVAMVKELAQLMSFDGGEYLTDVAMQGKLQGRVSWSQDRQPSMWLNIDDLGWSPFNGIPGVNDVRLELVWQEKGAAVTLFSENTQLETAEMFRRPLDYEQLNAELQIYQQNNIWHVTSDALWFNDPALTVAGEMRLILTEQPKLDLYAEVYGGNAITAGDYYPQSVMSENLIEYLNRGIVAGQHQQSQVLLSGPLDAFPFEQGDGHFEVLSQISDAEFLFAPDWPTVKNAEVTLHFLNERMDIYANQGLLINQQLVRPVVITLPNLNQADNLYVNIDHTTPVQSLRAFFDATPLKDPLVNVLDIVQGQGQVSGQVNLDIDLNTLGVNAVGQVDLGGTEIYLSQPGMLLTNVNGTLHFNDDRIELKGSSANWLDMPIEFDVLGDGDSQTYDVNVGARLLAQADKMLPYAQGLLDGFIAGETHLHTTVNLRFAEQGFSYLASLESTLEGVSSEFATPYNKSAEESWGFQAQIKGDDISNLITANLANKLFFNGILDNETGLLSQAQLSVGKENAGLVGTGFHVSILQEDIVLDDWLTFIDRLIEIPRSQPGEQTILPELSMITARFNQTSIATIPFNDVEMRLFPSVDGMTMKLNAKELRATVLLPEEGSSRPIKIDSDYLRINFSEQASSVGEQSAQELDWLTRIPAIEFNCSDCKVDVYQLDKVSASLFGDGKQLSITELVVDKEDHVLRGQGRWRDGLSSFDGILNSKDIGELFDEFDLTSTIKDSRANVAYQLSWQGAPYDFDLESLGGEVTWELGEGHLAEVSDQGARVFSLLSLDSLIRKLKLDFRDVFSKGFFYNQMQGSIQLDKGIAYTKDTKLDGVPADLTIQGYANLNTQEINYDLAVAPQVTSSIPVIVAWMVNPVSGLAALALDKVIHSARVISEIKFKVTGTMNEPVVLEIDRKSREVEIPQAAQNEPPSLQSPPQQGPREDALNVFPQELPQEFPQAVSSSTPPNSSS